VSAAIPSAAGPGKLSDQGGDRCEHVQTLWIGGGNATMTSGVVRSSDRAGVVAPHFFDSDAPPFSLQVSEGDLRSLNWHDLIGGSMDEKDGE